MNSIAAFQMANALDEERRQRAASSTGEVHFKGRQSWRPILRIPRIMTAPSKG